MKQLLLAAALCGLTSPVQACDTAAVDAAMMASGFDKTLADVPRYLVTALLPLSLGQSAFAEKARALSESGTIAPRGEALWRETMCANEAEALAYGAFYDTPLGQRIRAIEEAPVPEGTDRVAEGRILLEGMDAERRAVLERINGDVIGSIPVWEAQTDNTAAQAFMETALQGGLWTPDQPEVTKARLLMAFLDDGVSYWNGVLIPQLAYRYADASTEDLVGYADALSEPTARAGNQLANAVKIAAVDLYVREATEALIAQGATLDE
ncbi:MAG: hypothetical protein ACU0CO_16230 [Shimia sp.]